MFLPISQVVTKLSASRVNLLLRRAGSVSLRPEDRIGPGECLLLWTAEILHARAPIVAEQQELLLEAFLLDLVKMGVDIASGPSSQVEQLVLTDGTFASLSGRSTMLDLRTGEEVQFLMSPPLEIVAYSLRALFNLQKARIEETS